MLLTPATSKTTSLNKSHEHPFTSVVSPHRTKAREENNGGGTKEGKEGFVPLFLQVTHTHNTAAGEGARRAPGDVAGDGQGGKTHAHVHTQHTHNTQKVGERRCSVCSFS